MESDSPRDALLEAPPLPPNIGPYRVLGWLGGGGMGQVLDVMGPMGRVALKVARGEEDERRLAHEHEVLTQLDHPQIPTSHGLERHDDAICMAMTRYSGVAFDRKREGDSPKHVVGIATGLLGVLAHVHSRGIAHRDIKSSNVLVNGIEVCLVDFGVAQRFGEPALDDKGRVSGTALYMAPEIMQGGEVSAASDLYSVGVVLYRWLTGRWPFPDDAMAQAKRDGTVIPITVLRPSLPHQLESCLMPLLTPDPAERPSDVASVRGELLGLLRTLNARSSREEIAVGDDFRPTKPIIG